MNRILTDEADLSSEISNDLISIGETGDRELVYLNLNENTIITGKAGTGKTTLMRMIAQKIERSIDIPITVFHSKTTLKQAYSTLTNIEKNKQTKHILIVDDLEELITIKDKDNFTIKELKKKIDKKLFDLFKGSNNHQVTVIYGSGFYSKYLHKEYIEDTTSGTTILLNDSRSKSSNRSNIRELGTAIFKNSNGVFLQKEKAELIKHSDTLIDFKFFREEDIQVFVNSGSLIF